MNNSQKYFDPETLSRIRPLGLRARSLVEGLVAGFHRSPLHGQSIEFSQHREYAPGDDLRLVDWKAYARSDRIHLKQYEDETNFVANLLIDVSQSMSFKSETSHLSKLEYAQLICCCLTHLAISQQDQVAVGTLATGINHWLPASSSTLQFDNLVSMFEELSTSPDTDLERSLKLATNRITRTGIVIVMSDFLDEMSRIESGLRLLRCSGHDCMAIQILDRAELDFPFEDFTCFEGLELPAQLPTDPLLIGAAYRRAARKFCQDVEVLCRGIGIDYFLVRTSESLAVALPMILAKRSRPRR